MQSTRAIAILSLILSASALGIAVAGLSRSARPASTQSASVAAPLLDLQQAVEYASAQVSPEQARDEWLRLNRYYRHTYTHEPTGLMFDYLHEFELHTDSTEGGELIFVEHPSTCGGPKT